MKILITLLFLAVDISLGLAAIWLLLKASVIIAITAWVLLLVGLPTFWIAIIATLFTIGKWVYARKAK